MKCGLGLECVRERTCCWRVSMSARGHNQTLASFEPSSTAVLEYGARTERRSLKKQSTSSENLLSSSPQDVETLASALFNPRSID